DLGMANGIPQKDLEQAVSTQVTAEATLKAARGALRALGKTDAEISAMIAAGKLPSAPDPRRWVVANWSESDSALWHSGQTVQVKVTVVPEFVFDGKISRIYGMVDPNTHRVMIRCEVSDEKNKLRPGMLADVVIRIQEPIQATAIPADGVVLE